MVNQQKYNQYFTEEHELFREGFRDFLKQAVVPHIEKWEKEGKIERFIWEQFGEMGYLGLNYPERYGGLGLDLFYMVVLLEELQWINSGGFAAAIWAHTYLALTHINAEGSPSIKQRYLEAGILGQKIGCLCITEPFAGSDVKGIRTTAQRVGDYYWLNGSKTFITNGVYSDFLVVTAKTDFTERGKRMSLFVVDRDLEGISANKLNKLGWRASDTGAIAFDNVKVPVQNLLGVENQGFYYIMQHFALERLIMAVNAVARSEFALNYALQYMTERTAFGKTLTQFQALRHRIADMASEIEMHKQFVYNTVAQLNSGQYPVKEATMCKLLCTKLSDKVVYECLQFLGGYGFMEEFPIARLYRDSRLGPIGGGTSEILREIIAKMVIDGKSYQKPIE